MTTKRKVEIFSAGCHVCEETVGLIRELSCPSCELVVLDMKDHEVAQRAKTIGIRSVPAVLVDGELAGCCAGRGPNKEELQAAGVGLPLE